MAEHSCPDLATYRRKRTEQDPRIPRLVIVIDEFRSLADELPDLVQGLVRIAALGRSLGVHLVIATQRPGGAITADMIKPGAVVVDVGVNRIPDASTKSGFRLVGDVDYPAALEKAAAITPVPGGVGPMTITMLLYNTLESARRHGHTAGPAL